MFLDRDGVINRAIVRDGRPYPPVSVDTMELLPRVREALELLTAAGFDLIVVTDQPDVGRGLTRREVVDAINNRLRTELPLDEVMTCFHDDRDDCDCRKPKRGLLRMMEKDQGIALTQSFMIGDRWRDVEAGLAVGCKTVFLDYGYAERSPATQAHHVGYSLYEGTT